MIMQNGMNESPKVSVIMGIYNCAKTLPDSVDSILAQTYDNWELIMCDDASTDKTYEVAKQYADRYPYQIRLLHNQQNMRLAFSLNRCLEEASGSLIARMDGDDISAPDRLRLQVEYLMAHPEYQVVGTAMRRFDESGFHNVMHPPLNPDRMIMRNRVPFFHATILMRKSAYEELGGYTVADRTKRAEDLDLWFRFYNKGFAGNSIDEPLYFVREDSNAFRRRTARGRIEAFQILADGYKLLGFPKRWLIVPTLKMMFKCLVPYKFVEYYRAFQARTGR